jgi:hypothetical protein
MLRTLHIQEGVEVYRYLDEEHVDITFTNGECTFNVYELKIKANPVCAYFDGAMELYEVKGTPICTHPIAGLVKHIIKAHQHMRVR